MLPIPTLAASGLAIGEALDKQQSGEQVRKALADSHGAAQQQLKLAETALRVVLFIFCQKRFDLGIKLDRLVDLGVTAVGIKTRADHHGVGVIQAEHFAGLTK